jgi:tetratricopeptide (TPR) repeat protein
MKSPKLDQRKVRLSRGTFGKWKQSLNPALLLALVALIVLKYTSSYVSAADGDMQLISGQAARRGPVVLAALQKKKVPATPPPAVKKDSLPVQGLPAGFDNVVALTNQKLTPHERVKGSLLRELVRQAMMIAAENELDLATFDPSMGESFPETSKPQSFASSVRMNVISEQGERGTIPIPTVQIELVRPTAKGPGMTWQGAKFVLPNESRIEFLAEHMATQSRSTFVEALRKVGYKKSTKKSEARAADVSKLEDHLDVVSQFALVREFHLMVRQKGESPEAVAGLVRAYANLGSLTDYHWSPSHKVFAARSLIYAERLIAKSGKTPFTLSHRAYALALAGRHATAMEAVQTARSAKGAAAPAWLDLIEAYCAYQPDGFVVADDSLKELAGYLRMRMLRSDEADLRDPEATLQYLTLHPGCGVAVEMLSDIPFPGIQSWVINCGFPQMWHATYERLAAIPDLPSSAKEIAEKASGVPRDAYQAEYPHRVQFIDNLQEAKSTDRQVGPSWKVLADLLQNESFVQAWRTLDAQTKLLNGDKPIQELKTLVQDHPFRGCLDGFSDDESVGPALEAILNGVDLAMREVPTLAVTRLPRRIVSGTLSMAYEASVKWNRDNTHNDLSRMHDTNGLNICSPNWPTSIVGQITFAWEASQKRIEGWERTHVKSPVVVKALVKEYKKLNRSADAVRLLKSSVAAAETQWALTQLAILYDEQGNSKEWLATLERAIEVPDAGPQLPAIHETLANYYMRRGEWKKAAPHAAFAGQFDTASGRLVATNCFERLNEYDKAEEYVKALSLHCDGYQAEWFFWCVRTGHGDREAAQKVAQQYWTGTQSTGVFFWSLASGQLIEGDRVKARATLVDAVTRLRSPAAGLYAAVLADGDGDNQARDELFRLVEQMWIYDESSGGLSVALRRFVSGDAAGQWKTESFDKLIGAASPESVPLMYCAAGMVLRNHGQQELGDTYLQSAATSFYTYPVGCLQATIELRSRKVPIGPARMNVVSDAIAPICGRLASAAIATRQQKFDDALAIINELLKAHPTCLMVLLKRAELQEKRHDYAAAVVDYKEALKQDPSCREANLGLAWLLSTCPQDDIRNGTAALKYAETVASYQTFLDCNLLSTMAAAQAECGFMDQAVQLETRAQRIFGFKIGPNRLRSYTAGKPFRHTP